MGKRIIAQKRGRGSSRYRVHSFKYKGRAKVASRKDNALVVDLIGCRGHTAPLAQVLYDDGQQGLIIAPEGVGVGDTLDLSPEAKIAHGNIVQLKNIPEGITIFNIEAVPNDGGKFVRSSGAGARIISRSPSAVVVQFPSRKQKKFNPNCRATIGVVAGGGRVEKPFLNAGRKFYSMRARNKLWPTVSANAMNAVDHPFGNSRSLYKAKSRPAPRNAPPGRRVGHIRPRKTGRSRSRRN